jgi:hypothetical protein
VPANPVPVIKQEFPGRSGDPYGTHTGLTISGNLLVVQQRRQPHEHLMYYLRLESKRIKRETGLFDAFKLLEETAHEVLVRLSSLLY